MHPEMTGFNVVIQRCGTSKGIFIKQNELPTDIVMRNRVIRAIFGGTDRRQIDGLGGADVLTSKLAIIAPSSRKDADIDYTFAQVSFDSDLVDYKGNCGNISAGVGPFAIDEGFITPIEPITTVRINQTNTNCIIIAKVPVKNGKACVCGDYKIDGVPGYGSKISLDFSDTTGSTTGRLLPTGNSCDVISTDKYGDFEVSIIDAGNVVVFIRANDLGLHGCESCAQIEATPGLQEKIEAIRSVCAAKIGMVSSPEEATAKSPYSPFFAIVSPPQEYKCPDGHTVHAGDIDITARLSFMLHMHKTYPGTGTVATGAAARIKDSIVYQQLSKESNESKILRIGHPCGVIEINASAHVDQGQYVFDNLAYDRTARRIMDGTVYVKNEVLNI